MTEAGKATRVVVALQSMLPLGVEVSTGCIDDYDGDDLRPEEAISVVHACPARIREFAAGRACARQAARVVLGTDISLPVGHDRAPRWPETLVGSITHSVGIAAAAVAPTTRLESLGIDLEAASPLERDLLPLIASPVERLGLSSLGDSELGSRLKLMFCCKEAVYKFQYPLTSRFLDFTDVSIEYDHDAGTFIASLIAGTKGSGWLGSFRVVEGLVIAATFASKN